MITRRLTAAVAGSIIVLLLVLAATSPASAETDYGFSQRHSEQSSFLYSSSPSIASASAPSSVTSLMAEEVRLTAYTTGYATGDNTPAGSARTDLDDITGKAGGTGTYADPITLAVGHSIIGGKDIADYPYGTRFYVPNLKRYFKAADSCGDGSRPQNGPCHAGYRGHVWLDLYVGDASGHAVLACQDAITDVHLVIVNPAPTYSVIAGPIYDTGCSKQYGDEIQ